MNKIFLGKMGKCLGKLPAPRLTVVKPRFGKSKFCFAIKVPKVQQKNTKDDGCFKLVMWGMGLNICTYI